ncbi:MAG: aminomethyl transferase family protein, partial [Caulobacteraceae bacterium]
GLSMYTAIIESAGTILSLGLVDKAHAAPGTEVTIAWGEHPGSGTPPEAHRDFPRIRARVEASPYDEHARTQYRKD